MSVVRDDSVSDPKATNTVEGQNIAGSLVWNSTEALDGSEKLSEMTHNGQLNIKPCMQHQLTHHDCIATRNNAQTAKQNTIVELPSDQIQPHLGSIAPVPEISIVGDSSSLIIQECNEKLEGHNLHP